jgi:hypothetical protein
VSDSTPGDFKATGEPNVGDGRRETVDGSGAARRNDEGGCEFGARVRVRATNGGEKGRGEEGKKGEARRMEGGVLQTMCRYEYSVDVGDDQSE